MATLTTLKFLGIVSLATLVVASSADAAGKKGGSRAKSRSSSKDSASSGLTMVAPPSSLLEPTLPASSPPPPPPTDSRPTPAPAESTPPQADSPPDADADHPRIALLPLVLVGVEPRLEGRILRQAEFTQDSARNYGALGYPSVALTGELYPAANLKSNFLRGLGVTFHLARAFGFQSDRSRLGGFAEPNTPPVDTSFMRYSVGVRYRIHANPESENPLVLGISASMSRWNLAFSEEPLGPDVQAPTANYRLGRFGVDGALELKKVTLYGGAYYLQAFSIGAPNTRELDSVTDPYLANAPGMGGEFQGSVGVRVSRVVEIRATVEYAILAYHLRPVVGSATKPDRVLDSYLSAGVGPYVSF